MRSPTFLIILATLLLAVAGPAAAHKTTYSDDGKIKIAWGFLNEPAVTHTKTGLDLILSDNATGAPIAGAEGNLTASLMYGDDKHTFDNFRGQHGQVGRYTDVITLTRPGLYQLHLKGSINGTNIDIVIPAAHEAAGIDETFFPTPLSNPFDATKIAQLEARIAALEAKATTQSTTPAPVTTQTPASTTPSETPGFGIPALVAGLGIALLLARNRRS